MNTLTPVWVNKMNDYFGKGIPFLAIISFDREIGEVYELDDCASQEIYYNVNGKSNRSESYTFPRPPSLRYLLPNRDLYNAQFCQVSQHIKAGNTYLINLCSRTELLGDLDLLKLFDSSQAPYRLYFRDEFVVFSPEPFVRVEQGQISAFPMKGTIDAGLDNAAEQLLSDKKERAEHYTIVDLIRNDVGAVCDSVDVDRFAFIQEFPTSKGPVLQMSSEISGKLSQNFIYAPGDLFYSILPAGSITGAPKQKTVEILKSVESTARGFYTGVMVLFDGAVIDSGVLIRFIERSDTDRFYYRSGGGITHQSDVNREYEELARKVYLPFF